MKISEAFESYARDVIAFKGQSKKTEENHFIAMRSLIAFTDDIEVSELQFGQVRNWKMHLDQGRSAETVRNYIIKLRVVLDWLKRRGYDSLDPELVPVPKRTDKVPDFVTAEEVKLLIQATPKPRNKAIISLLYASGIRVSELCQLNRGDIRDDTFTVVGKGGKARLCFIDERTTKLLAKYLETRSDNMAHLFSGKFDSHRLTAGNVQEIFRYARKNAGFTNTVHPHTMRHSFATNLLRNNMNIRYVQELLGHSNLQTTQMYTHVVNEDLHRVYREHHTI